MRLAESQFRMRWRGWLRQKRWLLVRLVHVAYGDKVDKICDTAQPSPAQLDGQPGDSFLGDLM